MNDTEKQIVEVIARAMSENGLDDVREDDAEHVLSALKSAGYVIVPKSEYICRCGLRVEPHRCRDTLVEF